MNTNRSKKINRLLEEYKKNESLLTDYQLVKAYFNENCGVLQLIGRILRSKYNLEWQDRFIRKAIECTRVKKNSLVSIPKFNFEETTESILAKFVEKNFDKMVKESKVKGTYPLQFRELIEKYS